MGLTKKKMFAHSYGQLSYVVPFPLTTLFARHGKDRVGKSPGRTLCAQESNFPTPSPVEGGSPVGELHLSNL